MIREWGLAPGGPTTALLQPTVARHGHRLPRVTEAGGFVGKSHSDPQWRVSWQAAARLWSAEHGRLAPRA